MRSTPEKPSALALWIGLAVAVVVGGCVTAVTMDGLRFSHRLHVTEVECADCHADGARPSHAICADCHDIDVEQPSEACRMCHTQDTYQVKSSPAVRDSDLLFDHEVHADLECDRCHAGIADSAGTEAAAAHLPSMATCTVCHDGDEAPAGCAVCHEEIREDRPPASHNTVWARNHGPIGETSESCAYCHGENGCTDCHQTRRPRDHTVAWKNSRHGIEADFDRDSCAVCHRADQCSRCHRERPPSHFAASFRLPTTASVGHARLVFQRGSTRSCRVCHAPGFCAQPGCHPGGI